MTDKDNTKGEIKHIRGSGPPMLSVEGDTIGIGDRMYLLSLSSFNPQLPRAATVIGMDLTRRTIRFQLVAGRELLYAADGGRHTGNEFVFSTKEQARHNSVSNCEKAVSSAERKADEALESLEKAKSLLANAEVWEPDE